jgi:hypothetical protein
MGEIIQAAKDFVYLGSNQSTKAGKENEIQRRVGQANRAYFSLLPIMRSEVIHRQAKMRLYKMVIRSVLWYASESWTCTQKSKSTVDKFEKKVLRRILGPTKENSTWRIRCNNELYKQFAEPSIPDIKLKRLR